MITSEKPNNQSFVGGVAEWLNAPVLKTDVGESLPWVRIPPPPPQTPNKHWEIGKALKWEPFSFQSTFGTVTTFVTTFATKFGFNIDNNR